MPTPLRTRCHADLALGLLLVIVTALAFEAVRGHDFVNLDDPRYVYRNPIVGKGLSGETLAWAFTSFEASNWHPLTWISHLLDVELFGLDPGAHHLSGLALHLLATVLLFATLVLSTGARWPAAFVAALFGIHPTHVESVAWVAERKDTLSAVFWFLTMLLYVRHVRAPSRGRYAAVLVTYALGLLAKPMLVSLPLALLVFDLWPQRRPRTRALLWETVPLLVLALGSGVVTLVAQSRGGAVASLRALPLEVRLGNAALSFLGYLEKLFWPVDLAVFYPHPGYTGLPAGRVALAVIVLTAITAVVVWQRRARPYLLAGWTWFIVTLIPVIGILQVGAQAMADRYTYLPAVGVFFAVAWLCRDLADTARSRRVALGVLAIGALAALFARTREQVAVWKDGFSLYGHALAVTGPDNWMAWTNLGNMHFERGDHARAIHAFREALRVEPQDFATAMNLGAASRAAGHLDDAAQAFAAAARLAPEDPTALLNLADALAQQGRLPAAIDAYEQALRIAPGHPEALRDLALAQASVGQWERAVETVERLREVDPVLADRTLRYLRSQRGP